MLYHLISSNDGDYIVWVTNDDASIGIYVGRWSSSMQLALACPLYDDTASGDIDWVAAYNNEIILSSPTPITYSTLIENHPEILL